MQDHQRPPGHSRNPSQSDHSSSRWRGPVVPYLRACCLGIGMPVFRSISADRARPAETAASLHLEEHLTYHGSRSASPIQAGLSTLLHYCLARPRQGWPANESMALSLACQRPPSVPHIPALPADLMLDSTKSGRHFLTYSLLQQGGIIPRLGGCQTAGPAVRSNHQPPHSRIANQEPFSGKPIALW